MRARQGRAFVVLALLVVVARAGALTYDLTHLNATDQDVCGPIQDDEALFLYALVRALRMRSILEIGGLSGYSARNFLAAMSKSRKPKMFTVDVVPVPAQADNHVVITKDATALQASDFDGQPLDLVFFDCHDFDVQMEVYRRLFSHGLITDSTVLALHDTDTHPRKSALENCSVPTFYNGEGYIHQLAERRMVNEFKLLGYDVLSLHTPHSRLLGSLHVRHGLTVCTRFRPLQNTIVAQPPASPQAPDKGAARRRSRAAM